MCGLQFRRQKYLNFFMGVPCKLFRRDALHVTTSKFQFSKDLVADLNTPICERLILQTRYYKNGRINEAEATMTEIR